MQTSAPRQQFPRLSRIVLVMALLVWPSSARALSEIWMGSRKIDPITDKPNSIAWISSLSDEVDLVLRCRQGKADILLSLNKATLASPVGTRLDVIYRYDQKEPAKTQGAVTSSTMLALDVKSDVHLLADMLSVKRVVFRFTDRGIGEVTGVFQATWSRANALTKIGRVLADCGIAPYPEAEIEATLKEERPNQKDRRPGRR